MPSLSDIRSTLPTYPIEVDFPDISRWRTGNCGIDYLHSRDSGQPGPHVLILALVHGNEVSGAIAVDLLLRENVHPVKGRLSLGFANVKAYEGFDIKEPDASRFVDEDLNRVWSESALDGDRDTVELRRARELRPFIDTVDLLLDIHSMHEASEPLMMCGPLEKGRRFAAELGFPKYVIVDAGHADGKRLRDYGDFGNPDSPRNALLVETGQHFAKKGQEVAIDTACRFLMKSGVVSEEAVSRFLTRREPSMQHFIEITEPVVARSMDFHFAEPFKGLETMQVKGTSIARDGDHNIVTPYDNCVIIQPSLRQLSPGVTVMRLGRFMQSE